MCRNSTKFKIIIQGLLLVTFASCSGINLNPVHEAKFTFEGKVVDFQGNPVPKAWVKVRGWETLTNNEGRWHQDQLVHCGALREHPDSFDEADAVLVSKNGYESVEEKFLVKHPRWFADCLPEQKIVFETKLAKLTEKPAPTFKQSEPRPITKGTTL